MKAIGRALIGTRQMYMNVSISDSMIGLPTDRMLVCGRLKQKLGDWNVVRLAEYTAAKTALQVLQMIPGILINQSQEIDWSQAIEVLNMLSHILEQIPEYE